MKSLKEMFTRQKKHMHLNDWVTATVVETDEEVIARCTKEHQENTTEYRALMAAYGVTERSVIERTLDAMWDRYIAARVRFKRGETI